MRNLDGIPLRDVRVGDLIYIYAHKHDLPVIYLGQDSDDRASHLHHFIDLQGDRHDYWLMSMTYVTMINRIDEEI